MANGEQMNEAALEAVLNGSDEDKLTFSVRCSWAAMNAIEQIPDQIEEAIRTQRRRDRRMIIGIASAIATVISIATPIIIHIA